MMPFQEGTHHKLLAQKNSKFCKYVHKVANWIIVDILMYNIFINLMLSLANS